MYLIGPIKPSLQYYNQEKLIETFVEMSLIHVRSCCTQTAIIAHMAYSGGTGEWTKVHSMPIDSWLVVCSLDLLLLLLVALVRYLSGVLHTVACVPLWLVSIWLSQCLPVRAYNCQCLPGGNLSFPLHYLPTEQNRYLPNNANNYCWVAFVCVWLCDWGCRHRRTEQPNQNNKINSIYRLHCKIIYCALQIHTCTHSLIYLRLHSLFNKFAHSNGQSFCKKKQHSLFHF